MSLGQWSDGNESLNALDTAIETASTDSLYCS